MFLTPEEVRDLTDKKQSAAQIRVLVRLGYAFDVGASGRPKVLRESVEARLIGRESDRHSGPDLKALRNLG